jgi:predicted nucleic acid-binding protein
MHQSSAQNQPSPARGRSSLADTRLRDVGSGHQHSESVLEALDIELRSSRTSFWDTLIPQAAESAGATILYTEDLAIGQRYRAIQVVNPLIHFGTQ